VLTLRLDFNPGEAAAPGEDFIFEPPTIDAGDAGGVIGIVGLGRFLGDVESARV
jgi:hypothetical protein